MPLFRRALCAIIQAPPRAFKEQQATNQKIIAMKKLATELVDGSATENTTMELDNETSADMTTLKELIRKEQSKRDKKHDALYQQYAALKKELDELKKTKNSSTGGQRTGASQQTNRQTQTPRGRNRSKTPRRRRNNGTPRRNRRDNTPRRRNNGDRSRSRRRQTNETDDDGTVARDNDLSDASTNDGRRRNSNRRSNSNNRRSRTARNRR